MQQVNKPLVVTLVVHYNNEEDCIKVVKSLLNISYLNNKIVVVDNNSTNNSYTKLAQNLLNIACELIRNEINAGFGGGVNYGFQYAQKYQPIYIHVVNTDCQVVNSDYLGVLVDLLEKEEKIGVVGPAQLMFFAIHKILLIETTYLFE